MRDLSSTLTVLSTMITPVALILASGSLILTTSQRLGRVTDRVRKIAGQVEELAREREADKPAGEQSSLLYALLGRATRRARLLQRALASLYFTLSVFVATSAALGLVAVFGFQFTWLPIAFGIAGTVLLFYASLLLIAESRLAIRSIDQEMDYLLRTSRLLIPEEAAKKRKR